MISCMSKDQKMATNNPKMKGLLKGLRYISQIFENEEDEPEMQIGAPTDVKHVAHIGMDGNSSKSPAPSWMNDFNSPANGSDANEEKTAKSVSQDTPDVHKSSSKRDKHKSSKKSETSSSKPKKVSKDPTTHASESEDLTKKSHRRKKSKDVGLSRRKRGHDLDAGTETET